MRIRETGIHLIFDYYKKKRLNTEKRGLKQVNPLVKTMVYIDKNSEG